MTQASRPVAAWRAIADEIETAIVTGAAAPGARLETEIELAVRHGVNRHTVRRALARLAAEGLVEVTQGRGAFVRRVRAGFCLRPPAGFVADTQVELHAGAASAVSARVDIADALNLPREALVVRVSGVARQAGEPVALVAHFVSQAAAPGLLERLSAGADWDNALAAEGLVLDGKLDAGRDAGARVQARAASAREIAALSIPRHAPVLVVAATRCGAAGAPLVHTRWRMASDRVEIVEPADTVHPPATDLADRVR